jgi:hypothetical protein
MQEIRIEVPRSAKMPPPEGANYFHVTTSGPDVQLLVGYVDLLKLHHARTGGAKSRIEPEITHRFYLSVTAFFMLKRQLEEIEAILRKQGALVDAPEENQ